MTKKRKSDPTPEHHRILYGLANWTLFVAGVVNLVIGTWSAANSDAAIAATCLAAGLILLFAATIDRFESLKGLGIEAKTRKFDEKIVQADVTLRGVRKLTELSGSALLVRILANVNTDSGDHERPNFPRIAVS